MGGVSLQFADPALYWNSPSIPEGSGVASRKGSTGLEWLLREADTPAPAADEAQKTEASSEPWKVQEPAKREPGLKNADKRAHRRATVPCEVRYKKGSEQISGRCHSLSLGGFFVETTKFLPDGEVFQAQIVFSSESGN